MPDERRSPMLDDCQRANEDPLSFGGRWAPVVGGQANWNHYGGCQLYSNSIMEVGVVPSSTCVSYWTRDIFADQVEIWGRAGAGFDLSEGWRLFLNLTGVDSYPGSLGGYELMINAAVGTDYWRIYEWSGGKTELAYQPASPLGTNELCLFRYDRGDISAWRSSDNGANWTQVITAFSTAHRYGYIGLGVDQDDNNPSWRGIGGGEIKRTQIYRYVSN